jgi:hypothetical protein
MLLADKPSSRPAHGPVAFASMPGGRTGLCAGAAPSSRNPPADGAGSTAVALRPHLRPGKTHATKSQSRLAPDWLSVWPDSKLGETCQLPQWVTLEPPHANQKEGLLPCTLREVWGQCLQGVQHRTERETVRPRPALRYRLQLGVSFCSSAAAPGPSVAPAAAPGPLLLASGSLHRLAFQKS